MGNKAASFGGTQGVHHTTCGARQPKQWRAKGDKRHDLRCVHKSGHKGPHLARNGHRWYEEAR